MTAPMTNIQLWLIHGPIIVTSFATLLVAWTGLRKVQISQRVAEEKAKEVARLAADDLERQTQELADANQRLSKAHDGLSQKLDTLASRKEQS